MYERLVPSIEEIERRVAFDPDAASLMTPLGVIEGEILTYLEAHGATAVRRLSRELLWPSPMIMMAVGALIREGIIRATQHDLEVVLSTHRNAPVPHLADVERTPEGLGRITR